MMQIDHRRKQWTVTAVILSLVLVAVVLLAVAMAFYPGGSLLDRTARGYDFWRNFLCDLAGARAMNGAPNPVGHLIAPLALMLLALAMGLTWIEVPRLFPCRRRLSQWIRITGTVSALALLLLSLTLYVPRRGLHSEVVLAAAVPGILAEVGSMVGLWSLGTLERWLAGLAGGSVLSGIGDAVLYARRVWGGAPPTELVPILQRLTTLLFLVWMAGVARQLWRLPAGAQREDSG